MEDELEITRLNRKGHGIASLKGLEVELPRTLPGERVLAGFGRAHRRLHAGRMLELLKPSPDRIEPKCIHFRDCGGCALQHLSYEGQLKEKEERVRREVGPTEPIIPCAEPWHYRNKMEFSFGMDAQGKPFLGLMRLRGHGHILDLQECHLTPPWFIETLDAVRTWWATTDLGGHPRGILRTLILREAHHTSDRLVMLTSSEPLPDGQGFVDCLLPCDGELTVIGRVQHVQKGEPTTFHETILAGPGQLRDELRIRGFAPLKLLVSPSAFMQPNPIQAEILYKLALDLADLQPTSLVYDLYCGTGTLAMLAGTIANQVIGIELNPDAVRDGQANLLANNLTSVTLHAGDVATLLPTLPHQPDTLLVDPPRAGLATAIPHILTLAPQKIVYISCNPTTQAADIQELTQSGYTLTTLHTLDQFPHTPHIETIALLRANPTSKRPAGPTAALD